MRTVRHAECRMGVDARGFFTFIQGEKMKLRTLLVSSLLLGTCVAVSAGTTAALNSGVSGGRLISGGNQPNPPPGGTPCAQSQEAPHRAKIYNSRKIAGELT